MKYLLILTLTIFSCNNTPTPINTPPITTDTVIPIDANTVDAEVNTDTAFAEPTLETILKDFVTHSTDTLHIDTPFTFNNASYRLKLNYYCLFDSALIVPMEYVESYGMMEFITNNYAADIKLFKTDDEILDTTISKNDFIKVSKMHDPVKYRLLFQPTVRINPDSVTVAFSLSVPLTDIGEGVELPILKKPKK